MIGDDALLEDRLAIVGTAGSGKTYAAGVLTERLLALGHRVIIVDPLGVWYGLRLAPDGQTPSPFQPVIFGGRHGDMAITEQSGQIIGEAVAGASQSAIIDLSQFGVKAVERRFMLAFLTALYRKTEASPVHLIFDEADMWAPQVLMDKDGDAARLLGMMETIVRRGRVKGFTPWLITQRPAVLSKNVLSQADGVIAFKLTSSQDRDAIGAWVEGQADKAQWRTLYAQLATLPRGRGVVWIPGRQVLSMDAFPAKTTFDSSRTPKHGEAQSLVTLTAIDIGALKEKVKSVEEEAKASDPKTLRAEIARLRTELVKAGQAKDNGNAFTQADIDKTWIDAFEAGSAYGYNQGARDVRDGLSAAIASAVNAFHPPQKPAIPVPQPPQATPRSEGRQVEARGSAPHRAVIAAGHALPAPQAKVMRSLMFWTSIGTMAPSRSQVAAVAGYSPGSGGFKNLLGQLKSAGRIDYPSPGLICPTPASGFHETMLVEEARNMLMSILSNPHKTVLNAIPNGKTVTRDAVAHGSGYSADSGGFKNLLGKLRTLDIIEYPSPGMVCLTDWAREVLGHG